MTVNIDDKLNDVLDIPASAYKVVEEGKEILQQADVIIESADAVDDDFEYARKNLRDVIERGQEAISGIMMIAREGESPRAYEVISQLINTIASANKDLLDLSKKYKDINSEVKNENTTNVTNNSLFVGSTAELHKLISGKTDDEDEDE